MSFLLWILIGAANGFFIMMFSSFFQIPAVITLAVLIPLDVIALTVFSFLYNFRGNVRPEPVPGRGFDSRRADLDRSIPILESMGFKKIDEFFLKIIPDALVYCFQHSNGTTYVCLYHLGPKQFADAISLYNNEVSLTTGMSPDGGNIPPKDRAILQIFPNASLETLLQRHADGVEFLRGKGYEPISHSPSTFREEFMRAFREVGVRVQKMAFWPVLLIFWVVTSRGQVYLKSVEEQFRAGMIKIQ